MTALDAPSGIRNLHPKDEGKLLEICYLTGHTSLEDRYLFGLRWCLYYLWHQPQNSFVAVDYASGEVLGYILGALNTAVMEQHFRAAMVPQIKKRWKQYHPKSITAWTGYLALRLAEISVFKKLFTQYPAHLHINIHPDHQRKGVGQRLIAAYEANLLEHNIPGYHLVVGADNQAGISFYRKLGLTQLQKFPPFGRGIVIAFGKKFS